MAIVAAALHAPRRRTTMAVVAAVLAGLHIEAVATSDGISDASGNALVFGRHPVNGLILMALDGMLVRTACTFAQQPAPDVTPAARPDRS
ncbi:hypothetical protein [Solicola gregarius]|uniref:Uncharacterized protein n=1 Tax=Solicola gregarius TaxID=2908642 RepID=A0AA46TJ68_9ACTN|nr:hypothetical protein [Solicola gregarius]UYM06339.1 hypothetical protein L0C25_04475 [Solicola gregarius]